MNVTQLLMPLPAKACALVGKQKSEFELREWFAGARIARDGRYPCKPASARVNAEKQPQPGKKKTFSKL